MHAAFRMVCAMALAGLLATAPTNVQAFTAKPSTETVDPLIQNLCRIKPITNQDVKNMEHARLAAVIWLWKKTRKELKTLRDVRSQLNRSRARMDDLTDAKKRILLRIVRAQIRLHFAYENLIRSWMAFLRLQANIASYPAWEAETLTRQAKKRFKRTHRHLIIVLKQHKQNHFNFRENRRRLCP